MRAALKAGLEGLLHYSGAARFYARLRSLAGATILMYHSVADEQHAPWIDPANRMSPARFEAHLRFLRRHRQVLSLTEVVACLRSERACPRGSVVLTFDDGYLDTLTVAAELLARYDLPAILYLPTAYIDRAENHWADMVHTALRNVRPGPVTIAGTTWQMPDDVAALRRWLHTDLLPATAGARHARVLELVAALGPEAPPRLTMNWDEVRQLVRAFPRFEIGAHTVEHIDLRTHSGAAARYELEHARARIAEELGTAPRHMSYPYGRACADSIDRVLRAGYESAVISADLPRVEPGVDLAALPRIAAPEPVSRLALWTSGGHPYLQRALLGRNS